MEAGVFNAAWGAGFVVLHMIAFLLCVRFFGKEGLFAWVGVATVLANVQVVKTIDVFGLVTTLGNTTYASMFLATDLLNERYGEATARKAVHVGLLFLLVSTGLMQWVLYFEPAAQDMGNEAMQTIFGFMPRVALASVVAYAISQYLDVRLFAMLRRKDPRPSALWKRSAGSTIASQLIDSTVFCGIAFWGVYTTDVWLSIWVSTIVFKTIATVLTIPCIQFARRISETHVVFMDKPRSM
ncbi:MAG: queuosine precursor transporter [Paenibacillaceae bacterium]|nr:queuosine precursor transporter [Paenibacillaceae bacterium]